MFAFKIKEPVPEDAYKLAKKMRLKIATNRLNLGKKPRGTVSIGSIPSKCAKRTVQCTCWSFSATTVFCNHSMASRSCQLLGKLPSRILTPRSIAPAFARSNVLNHSNMATITTYKVQKVENENNVR